MKYDRKITKIGNSYGVTVPADLLKEAGISYGDNVQLELKGGKIVMNKREDITLPEGISPDFFDVLEKNTRKHNETLKRLVDR